MSNLKLIRSDESFGNTESPNKTLNSLPQVPNKVISIFSFRNRLASELSPENDFPPPNITALAA